MKVEENWRNKNPTETRKNRRSAHSILNPQIDLISKLPVLTNKRGGSKSIAHTYNTCAFDFFFQIYVAAYMVIH